jgi:hypothetical protein
MHHDRIANHDFEAEIKKGTGTIFRRESVPAPFFTRKKNVPVPFF